MLSLLVLASSILPLQDAADAQAPQFEAQTIGAIRIGYGLSLGDVNGDRKPDILLADKRQIVWYRNPDWTRFVMADGLSQRDNVCIAARDIDGDGRVEVAVGGNWNPGDTEGSGAVHYLSPPADRTQPWTPIRLHHEPVVHRMRWVRITESRFDLVVAPLHGRGNVNAQGAGARLLAYQMPADVHEPWKTLLIDDSLHLAHNFDCGQWQPETAAEEILYIGREGALLLSFADGAWHKSTLTGIEGGGEIRMGGRPGAANLIATIAPLHGNRLLIHEAAPADKAEASQAATFAATVLDDSYKGGHAIAIADMTGDEGLEVVAGWRLPNAEGLVGIKLYQRENLAGGQWSASWIDRGDMATEDLRIADLDGDGRPDIVAAGRASKNLKIYWNRARD